MSTLAEILGIDETSPEAQLALNLARGDRAFLRSLVRERTNQGLSQQDIADRLGITQPSVAAFERHDSDPKLSTIRRYAQAIGVMLNHEISRKWQVVAVLPRPVATAPTFPVVPEDGQRWVRYTSVAMRTGSAA